MTEHLFTRRAPLGASTWNADTWTFNVVLSTGAPVERWDARGVYDELLSVSGAAFPPAVPLLDSHSRDSVDAKLGQVDQLHAIGGELHGRATLSRHNPKSQRIAAELSDGQTFGVSIGYVVTRWNERKDEATGRRQKVAVAFEILEASLVVIPADRHAGIRSMTTETTAAAPETQNATTAERAVATTTAHTTESRTDDRAAVNAGIRGIARTVGLDQQWIDRQIDGGASLDSARAAALAEMQARSQATAGIRTVVSVGVDHSDPIAIRSAMADALAHRLAPGAVKLEGRGAEYRSLSLLDMVGELAVANGERINLRDQNALLQRAIGAHSTSDFSLILADAANKAALAQYQVAAPTYRKWSVLKSFNNFKNHSFLRIGDFPAFKEINENGEIKYGSISESAEKVRAKEFASGFVIGRRAVSDNDMSGFSDFTTMISIRAAADENRMAYAVLKANAALSDGNALFHADRGNKAGAGSTLAAGMAAAVKALREQKSLDGLPLNLQPAFLVVGPAQEVAARQILAAVVATKSADVNVWTGLAELVVDAEITDESWYLFTTPAGAPVVIYGYVGGAEGPQIRTERDFDTQAVKVAAGLDFAVGAIDFRGAYFNAGA